MDFTPASEKRRETVYGIPKGGFAKLIAAQDNRCPVCLREFSEDIRPCVDHDHRRGGRVRGTLCFSCNHRVVGRHTDAEKLMRAALYLKNPPAYEFGWPSCPPRSRSGKRRRTQGLPVPGTRLGKSRTPRISSRAKRPSPNIGGISPST